MTADAMLEAGWPAHFATYTGRTLREMDADWWRAAEISDDVARHKLFAEMDRHPAKVSRRQARETRELMALRAKTGEGQ